MSFPNPVFDGVDNVFENVFEVVRSAPLKVAFDKGDNDTGASWMVFEQPSIIGAIKV